MWKWASYHRPAMPRSNGKTAAGKSGDLPRVLNQFKALEYNLIATTSSPPTLYDELNSHFVLPVSVASLARKKSRVMAIRLGDTELRHEAVIKGLLPYRVPRANEHVYDSFWSTRPKQSLSTTFTNLASISSDNLWPPALQVISTGLSPCAVHCRCAWLPFSTCTCLDLWGKWAGAGERRTS